MLAALTGSPRADSVVGVTGSYWHHRYPRLINSFGMGMKLLDSWNKTDDRGAILGFSTAVSGEAFLELAYDDSPKQYGGMSLQFRVPDLANVEKKSRGVVEYLGSEERPWGSTYLYLTDPTGIPIIIFEGEL